MTYDILTLLAVAIMALLMRFYLPGYMSKKGENLATKEDVEEITKKVEEVKQIYAKDLLAAQMKLHTRSRISEVRYENEYSVLMELSGLLVEVRDEAKNMRPVADMIDPSEPEATRKQKRLDSYRKAALALYDLSERKRPFYPEEIWGALKELRNLCWREAVEYKNRDPEKTYSNYDYWKRAEENAEKIEQAAERGLELIRKRVKYWENIDYSVE